MTEGIGSAVAAIDLAELRSLPRIAFYFRYPLRERDFRELRVEGCLRGHYVAKPLYGRLTPDGRVDRAEGFSGEVAAIFLPARARTARAAKLVLTRIAPKAITLPNGRRNWPAIRAAAERAIIEKFAAVSSEQGRGAGPLSPARNPRSA